MAAVGPHYAVPLEMGTSRGDDRMGVGSGMAALGWRLTETDLHQRYLPSVSRPHLGCLIFTLHYPEAAISGRSSCLFNCIDLGRCAEKQFYCFCGILLGLVFCAIFRKFYLGEHLLHDVVGCSRCGKQGRAFGSRQKIIDKPGHLTFSAVKNIEKYPAELVRIGSRV